eukprot:30821-Pelagococcus_subviridis.AAC.10
MRDGRVDENKRTRRTHHAFRVHQLVRGDLKVEKLSEPRARRAAQPVRYAPDRGVRVVRAQLPQHLPRAVEEQLRGLLPPRGDPREVVPATDG